MKKIYALAAVACMAFAANAQNGAPLYVCGDGEGMGWDPAAPTELTYAGGVYKIESNNLSQFKLSTTMGDWDTFNGGAIGVASFTKDMLDVPTPLEAWGDNTVCPWLGNYTIVVAGDLSTITLSTTTPEPDDEFEPLYFRGDMNEWGSPAEWKWSTSDGKVYKFTCADDQVVPAGIPFKIAAASWGKLNFGLLADMSSVPMDEDTVLDGIPYTKDPKNIMLDEEWNGVAWINIYPADGVAAIAVFSNDKDFVPDWATGVKNITIDNNEAEVYYNLQGVKVAQPESGLYIVVKGGKATKIMK